jgi:outer membrane protein OmpA-like peptidoglycan-associated protein
MIKLRGPINVYVMLFSLLLSLIIWGCAPKTVKRVEKPEDAIGRLRIISGDNVYLNKNRAASGMVVKAGDEVSTGSDSIAIVKFISGGFVELNENTDPIFDFFKDASCIFCRLVKGEIYAQEKCSVIETPDVRIFSRSEVNVKVITDHTIVTVRRGSVTTSEEQHVNEGQQIRVSNSDSGPVVELSDEEICAVVNWREGDCLAKLRPSPGGCDQYALTAVAQNEQNLKEGCGLVGDNWSSDYSYHHRWCLDSPKSTVISENNSRENALEKCKDLAQICDEYAKRVSAQKIFFKFDSVEFSKDPDEIIDEVTDFLSECTRKTIRIEGYADSTGGQQYNLRLSAERAKTIKAHLISRGVAEIRLKIEPKGEGSPIASNETKEGRSENRRIEFVPISK